MPRASASATIAVGTDEPPSTTDVIRARWSSVNDGWSRRLVRKTVAPLPADRSSVSMASRTSAGSHASISWIDSPRDAGSSNPSSIPVAWLMGAPRSTGRRPEGMSVGRWARTSAPSARCDWMTPFGLALVPEVYTTSAGLAGIDRH